MTFSRPSLTRRPMSSTQFRSDSLWKNRSSACFLSAAPTYSPIPSTVDWENQHVNDEFHPMWQQTSLDICTRKYQDWKENNRRQRSLRKEQHALIGTFRTANHCSTAEMWHRERSLAMLTSAPSIIVNEQEICTRFYFLAIHFEE